MKRLFVVLLALLLCLPAAWAEEEEATVYICGDYAYVLQGDGTAMITGYTGIEKDVTLPTELDGHIVTAIGDYTFQDDDLTSVVIPDSVTEVGIFPFTGEELDAELRVMKSTLTAIHLGSGVTALFWANNLISGFYGPSYPELAVITVSPDNPVYTVENGLLIDKTTSTVVCCPAAMTGEAIVPDWVTAVGDYAFAKASASYVYIPDSVTEVGEYVFSYATSSRIRLPGGLDMTFAKDDEKKLFPEAITDARMQALTEGLTKKEARILQDAYKQTGVDPVTGKSYYRKADDVAALEAAYPALKDGTVWILRNPDMKSNAIVKLNDAFKAASYTAADLALDYELTFGKPYPMRHPLANRLPYTLRCLDRKLSLPEGCELENLQGGLALLWAVQQGYTLVDVMVSGDLAYTLQADGTARIVGYFGEAETVTIPSNLDGHDVTAISDGAVSDIAVMVRATTLPDAKPVGGTEIGSIVIPDSLTDITGNPFRGLSGLTTIEVTQEHPTLALIDGVLFEKPTKRLVCYPVGLDRTGYEVPGGIRIIGADSFYGCTALTSVTLPDTVTEIGPGAFEGCTGLTSVTLAEGLQEIGANAFNNCTGLTNVVFLEGLQKIGAHAFSGCTCLTSLTLPEGLQEIGAYAFYNGTGLTSLTLPDGLQEIGAHAFNGCRGLTSLTLPDGLQKIGNGAFLGCRGLTSIVLPESLQEIGVNAFCLCDDLTSLTLPAMPYERWDGVFMQYHELTHIVIPDGFSMTYRAEHEFFMNLYALRTIEVSQEHPTLALIDGVLFDKPTKKLVRCTSAIEKTSYEIPRGIRSISGYAFNGCSGLINVTIPDTVTEIGDNAFAGCRGLTGITLPASVTEIGEGVFADCVGLTSITLPQGVTEIGGWTFSDCTGLTSITLPEGVTRIGEWAFGRCQSLTEMNIPASVTEIAPDAFTGCSDSLTLTIERDSAAVAYCKEHGIKYVYSDYLDWLFE